MKSKLKNINSYTKEIAIDVSWDDLKDNFIKTFKDFKKGYSIPGFRKGRVPDNIVKRNYGPAIEADFTEKSINKYYQLALQELKLFPINKAEINNLEFKEGSNLKYKARFEISPEFKLLDYKKKFKINAVRVEQTDTDLDEALLNLQKQHGTIKPVKNGAKLGHFIQGDFQELDESDLPIIGKKYEKQYICYGEGVFSGDGVLALEGVKPKESAKVNVNYGEGKKVRYEISVNRVDEQILPKIDDDFAKLSDPKIKTLDELKSKLKESIQQSLDKEFNNQIDQNISRYLVDKTKIDIPESMRENYINNVMEELKQKNKENKKLDKDEITKMYKDIADWNISWYLIRAKLIGENNISATKEEIDAKIEIASKNSDLPIDQVKTFYAKHENRHKIEDDIINEKLFIHLKEFANIKETSKTTDQLRKEKEKNG
tara:strand:- start:1159 stop:2448 length:1290 start_codon:yes stop_codon:yes gene_type:complete